MKTALYFFAFLICLFSTTYSLSQMCSFYYEGSFGLLFIVTFLSLAGSIVFGYYFSYNLKNRKDEKD